MIYMSDRDIKTLNTLISDYNEILNGFKENPGFLCEDLKRQIKHTILYAKEALRYYAIYKENPNKNCEYRDIANRCRNIALIEKPIQVNLLGI